MILQSGAEVGISSFKELIDSNADASLPPRIHQLLLSLRDPLLPSLPAHVDFGLLDPTEKKSELSFYPSLPITSIESVKVYLSGPNMTIDLCLGCEGDITVKELSGVEGVISRALKEELEMRISEVRIVWRSVWGIKGTVVQIGVILECNLFLLLWFQFASVRFDLGFSSTAILHWILCFLSHPPLESNFTLALFLAIPSSLQPLSFQQMCDFFICLQIGCSNRYEAEGGEWILKSLESISRFDSPTDPERE